MMLGGSSVRALLFPLVYSVELGTDTMCRAGQYEVRKSWGRGSNSMAVTPIVILTPGICGLADMQRSSSSDTKYSYFPDQRPGGPKNMVQIEIVRSLIPHSSDLRPQLGLPELWKIGKPVPPSHAGGQLQIHLIINHNNNL